MTPAHQSYDALAGRLLVAGVSISAACLGVGLALWLVGLAPGAASRLLDAGLLVLMATPTLRVLVASVEHARSRDWDVVLTCLAVLAVLGAGIVAALRVP